MKNETRFVPGYSRPNTPDYFFMAIQALTPNAMAEKFDMSRQAVSKHIRVLRECELIKPEQPGREI